MNAHHDVPDTRLWRGVSPMPRHSAADAQAARAARSDRPCGRN